MFCAFIAQATRCYSIMIRTQFEQEIERIIHFALPEGPKVMEVIWDFIITLRLDESMKTSMVAKLSFELWYRR